jgi:uncharacterized membrane protein YtjA (UPF0391 family)
MAGVAAGAAKARQIIVKLIFYVKILIALKRD